MSSPFALVDCNNFYASCERVANRFAKKDAHRAGVHVMTEEAEIEATLDRMALTDLWGVAGRMAHRLQEIGITNPLKLRDSDPAFIQERFNVVMQRMVLELRGVSCLAWRIMSRIARASSPRGHLAGRSPRCRKWKKRSQATSPVPPKKCVVRVSRPRTCPCLSRRTASSRMTRNTTSHAQSACRWPAPTPGRSPRQPTASYARSTGRASGTRKQASCC